MRLAEMFLQPPVNYRDIALWSWNDDLSPAELVRQVESLHEKGYGGFFVFSFYGLITRYLSDAWLHCVRRVIERAEQLGMEVWIYDEDRFPSGFAGGYVAAQDDSYRLCLMECAEIKKDDVPPGAQELMQWKNDGRTYRFFSHRPPGHPFYNNSCYADLLNPRAVDCFIQRTHETYYREFREYFGNVIKGFFTDEANVLHAEGYSCDARRTVPWTTALPDRFRERHGYDIRQYLPSLFFKTGDYRRIRQDFWSTVSEMFATSYAKRLYDWCQQHGVKLTGHLVYEDNIARQTPYIGSAMPQYEYYHIPGLDHLGKSTIYDVQYAIPDQAIRPWELLPSVKQPASVAHQLGRPRVFTEIYGAAGWDLSMDEQRWVGDWDCVLGANFRVPHLFPYSLRGHRKRVYPPSLFEHQPWWKHARLLTDYFARLNCVMSQGRFPADVLVIYPAESGWTSYAPGDAGEAELLDIELEKLSKLLMQCHRSYDYGHAHYLKTYGQVRGNRLHIGQCSYSVVIVSAGINLAKNTLSLLEAFVAGGGHVAALSPTPQLLDGRPSRWLEAFFSREEVTTFPQIDEQLSDWLDSVLPQEIRILDEDGRNIPEIWCHRRIIDDREAIFLLNVNRTAPYRAMIEVPSIGAVEQWNGFDGTVKEIATRVSKNSVTFTLSFAPGESHLIQLDRTRHPLEGEPAVSDTPAQTIPMGHQWRFRRDQPNTLLLDYCQYRIEGAAWSARVPVWRAEREIKTHYGIPVAIPGYELQTWKEMEDLRQLPETARVALRFTFEIDRTISPEQALFLVLETPYEFEVKVNDQSVAHVDRGWLYDRAFRKIDIAPQVHRGENVIEISCRYRHGLELESCFLAGDFAVRQTPDRRFVLVDEPELLSYGDIVTQGYPFFAGTMTYIMDVECPHSQSGRVLLDPGTARAMSIEVTVNGSPAGVMIATQPPLDISRWMRHGLNRIELGLTTSLRNLLGPHHHPAGDPSPVSPVMFSDPTQWIDDYHFVQYGLFEDCATILRDPPDTAAPHRRIHELAT